MSLSAISCRWLLGPARAEQDMYAVATDFDWVVGKSETVGSINLFSQVYQLSGGPQFIRERSRLRKRMDFDLDFVIFPCKRVCIGRMYVWAHTPHQVCPKAIS